MKQVKLIFLLLLILTSCSESVTSQTGAIENELTEGHRQMTRTNVFLIPPSGFDVSPDNPSITNGEFGINIRDMPGGNFWSNTLNFSEKNFEEKGFIVHEYRELQINSLPAILVDIESDYRSTQLVIGDSTFSVHLMGLSPKDDLRMNEKIKNSILTFYYDDGHDFDPLESASFSLNLSDTDLKFSNFSGDMFIYTTEGIEDQLNHPDGALLIVTEYPLDSQEIEPKAVTWEFVNSMKRQTDNFTVTSEGKGIIDGFDSYFVEAETVLSGKPVVIHNVSAVTSSKTYVIQTVAYENHEQNMMEFRKVIDSMKLK
jgi:hypothetical protein